MNTPTLRRPLCASVLALALAASPVHAAWPHDPFNSGVVVCGAVNNQNFSQSIPDGAGGVIVTWMDLRFGNQDIFIQRISAAGVPLWTANGVTLCSLSGDQTAPVIIADGSGGAIVEWGDQRAGNVDLYAQRINSAGIPQWTANGAAVCTAAGSQIDISLVSDGAGGACFVWSDNRTGTGDIYAQRINAAGTALWTSQGVPVCTATFTQAQTAAAGDGAGGVVLAWADARSGAADIYAQRLNAAGTAQWASGGVAVCTAAGDQLEPKLVADGLGAAILVWEDYRTGTADLYGQHIISSSGSGLWGSNGLPLCSATGDQFRCTVAADGAGGVVLAWEDNRSGTNSDIYSQRVSAGGTPLWTANGVALCTQTDAQSQARIVSDGAGGSIVVWEDSRGVVHTDIYGQRTSGAGVNQWTSNGVAICTANSNQVDPCVAPDGAGGAIAAWSDVRLVASTDIYAQRIERFGQLGNPEPSITGVKDVKNDQGGFVKVSWNASYLDADLLFGVFDYRVWRSVPASQVQQAALARGFSSDPDEAASQGRFLVLPAALGPDYAWEQVGTAIAGVLPSYSMVAATTGDSLGGSNPRTAFMVEARAGTSASSDRWYSAPDSGYSVDNLGPVAPGPLTGQYAAGTTALHWNRNLESDLAGYRLYRGTSAAFAPSPANMIAELPDTGYADAAGAPFVYKLTAIDAHGNESPVATLIPSGALAVGDAPALRTHLELASANPARGPIALRFGLTTSGRANLTIYDASGRRMRTLATGTREPGEYALTWDGHNEEGQSVPAGLYFARFEAQGFEQTLRIVQTN